MNQHGAAAGRRAAPDIEEGAGLISHAADPDGAPSRYSTYEEAPYGAELGYRGGGATSSQAPMGYPSQTGYQQQTHPHPHQQQPQQYPPPVSPVADDDFVHVPEPRVNMEVMAGREDAGGPQSQARPPPPPTEMQRQVGAALWGQNPHQHPGGPMI